VPGPDPFDKTYRSAPGQVVTLEPGVRVVAAPNPGPMTFTGTNTYLVGDQSVAIIDPGPDIADHKSAILAAIAGAEVSHILVTHSHPDHSALARGLSDVLGAPVCAFCPATVRSGVMAMSAYPGKAGAAGEPEASFAPDVCLEDGQGISGDGWFLTALHTPGHLSDHLCFANEASGAVFSGDHVMGWATTMVSPPDGDLTRFMASLDRMAARDDRIYYPGHGGPVGDPPLMIAWQIAHRHHREAQIIAAMGRQPATATGLARAIYTDIDRHLISAATRTVLAHLIDLSTRGCVAPVNHAGPLSETSEFRLI